MVWSDMAFSKARAILRVCYSHMGPREAEVRHAVPRWKQGRMLVRLTAIESTSKYGQAVRAEPVERNDDSPGK